MQDTDQDSIDGKGRAKRTWGASPAGTTSAAGADPGTVEFFERALEFRTRYEQHWLPKVVPFHEMRGKRVLEIGFGAGFDALTFLQSGADYSGVDITPENTVRAKKHLGLYGFTPDVKEGDAEALPFPDDTFDVVYSNGVLHHVPSMEKALAEACRVTKPGGECRILVYYRNSVFYRVTLTLWAHILRGGFREMSLAERLSGIEFNEAGERPVVNVYSKSEFRRLLDAAGFETRSSWIRKLCLEDLPLGGILAKFFGHSLDPALDWIGRLFGWYLIVHGVKR